MIFSFVEIEIRSKEADSSENKKNLSSSSRYTNPTWQTSAYRKYKAPANRVEARTKPSSSELSLAKSAPVMANPKWRGTEISHNKSNAKRKITSAR